MRDLNIKAKDSANVGEKLATYKKWFDGMRRFFTVKILPPSK